MRVLKLHSSLRYALSSALFAALWVLEKHTREKVSAALSQLEGELEQQVAERISTLTAENAYLIELDQLKSKFIADAAHELRSPITALNLRLYLLEHATSENRSQYLADFKMQLTRLTRLSEDLLVISWLDALDAATQFTLLDLNQIAEEMVITYRPMAESAGLYLNSQYAKTMQPVLGEHQQLVRMGSNLLANAIHYTQSGQILVQTKLDLEKQQACIEIQDSGVGIQPQDLPHLFERFYRGQQTNGVSGTGLGLSIVKEIVDLHGGSIHVESQVGKGSRFCICLPLAQAVSVS